MDYFYSIVCPLLHAALLNTSAPPVRSAHTWVWDRATSLDHKHTMSGATHPNGTIGGRLATYAVAQSSRDPPPMTKTTATLVVHAVQQSVYHGGA